MDTLIPPPFLPLFIAILGLEVGSFANVCIYRWPRELSVSSPARSFCPWCETQIRWYDNVPVLSFLFLGARCRRCHSPISWRYPAVEAVMACLWLGALYFLRLIGAPLIFLPALMAATFVAVVTTMTDLDWKIIPDEANLLLALAAFASAPVNPILRSETVFGAVGAAVVGFCVGGGVLLLLSVLGRRLMGKEVMGGGDVKLLAAYGALLGWSGALATLAAASCIGAVVSVAAIAVRRLRKSQYIPFGPFLNFAALLTAVFFLSRPNFFVESFLF
jgi:leader peptidase (prepilin peptidase)/N-methyltransferase